MTEHSEARRSAWTYTRVMLAASMALLGSVALAGDVEVVVREGRIDVSAENAPLSQVVEQIAQAIGAKVEYGGPPPDQLVTVALVDQTPTEVFLSVLHDQGADFAIQTDDAGTGVVKLVIATDTSVSENRPPPPPAEDPEPPTAQVLQDVMRQLGVKLGEQEAGNSDLEEEDENEPPAPELPEALQKLLNQASSGGDGPGADGNQNPTGTPPLPQLPFPTSAVPPGDQQGGSPQVP